MKTKDREKKGKEGKRGNVVEETEREGRRPLTSYSAI